MKKEILSTILFYLLVSSLMANSVKLGFPDGYTMEIAKEGKFDASSGDVLFATAVHKSGVKVEVSYNSRVPVKNAEIPRFMQFMQQQKLNGARFVNTKLTKKNGVNWCQAELQGDLKNKENRILFLFVSYNGSPMKIKFTGKEIKQLNNLIVEFIEHNNKEFVEIE